jgi:hypothetical protein
LKLVRRDVAAEFLEIVKNPPHGYGSNMNPCIDCRILLFTKARELMAEEGASFVITGEVVGQRPMSQRRTVMDLIDREAGLEGLVLRPLSAGILAQTIPEKKRWVSRAKMLSISGRGRNRQFALARELGVKDYPCPGGGCLLTDPIFCKKVRDLLTYDSLNVENVRLLRLGRHFRLSPFAKLVVGRDEAENERLEALTDSACLSLVPDQRFPGPSAVGTGFFNDDLVQLSLGIVARYCDGESGQHRVIRLKRGSSGTEERQVLPFEETVVAGYHI